MGYMANNNEVHQETSQMITKIFSEIDQIIMEVKTTEESH